MRPLSRSVKLLLKIFEFGLIFKNSLKVIDNKIIENESIKKKK